ncbi:cell division protein FtsJ [Paenibacillus athensensis]|uniref:Cell division protein FtsJ n=1 Tax=Paenibacillus athensensis TaxID=1967502 RepID=A0A4Y8QAZ1_9BACL|nr:cyclic-phosphate processing receiver domain-containing protein [Paenibacillus athensensis]MCD1257469.1 cell division protein FtsJ [Paenibacillus athensensis]
MIHVFLDDLRPCPRGFVWAKNVGECQLLLAECEVDVLSLDHDLGDPAESGMDVVRWLIAERRFPKRLYLHSSSREARMRMYQMLYAAKPETMQLQATPVPEELLRELARAE